MDHHGDWGQWHEDGSGFDGDTADLSGDHLGDLGGHDDGYPGHEGHEGYDGYDEQPDLSGHDLPGHDAPDLMHEGFDHDDQLDHHGYTEPDEPPAPADHLVGTDPDAPPGPDGAWHDGDFPPPLDLDARPEPSDGYPWADADTLGDPGTGYDEPGDAGGSAPVDDLFAYAGLDGPAGGVDPWSQLLAADDPATSALARFWGPAG